VKLPQQEHRRRAVALFVPLAIVFFVLGLDRRTTFISESKQISDGAVGPIELPNNYCHNRGISQFFRVEFSANWSNTTTTREHSTLFQLGATEQDGVRIDLGRSFQNPDLRSYFLIVGSKQTTDGYVWKELPIPIESQGSLFVRMSIYDGQVHVLMRAPNNVRLRFLSPAPNLNCRKLYFGEGPKNLIPQFSSDALYPSGVYLENLTLSFGERIEENRFLLPSWLDRIFDLAFVATIGSALLLALAQLSSRFVGLTARSVTRIRSRLHRVAHSDYITRAPRGDLVIQVSFLILLYVVAYGTIYARSSLGDRGFPWNSFLPGPTNQGADFFLLFSEWAIHGGLEGARNYGPASYWILEFLSAITPNPYTAILIFRLSTVLFVVALSFWASRSAGFVQSLLVTVFVVISYPMLFIIHTGNFESFTLIGLLSATIVARSGRWRMFTMIIGVLGAIKILPLLFLSVMCLTHRTRDCMRLWIQSLVVATATTAFSLVALPGGLVEGGLSGLLRSIQAIQAAFDFYYEFMVLGAPGINFGHSFLNGIHAIWGLQKMPSEEWGTLILTLFAVIGFLGLLILRFVKAPLWYGVLLIGVVGCVAPPTSTDYKLVYLVPGITLFMMENQVRRREVALILLAATTLAPKPYFYIGLNPFNSATLWLTTATLTVLTILIPTMGFQTYRERRRTTAVT